MRVSFSLPATRGPVTLVPDENAPSVFADGKVIWQLDGKGNLVSVALVFNGAEIRRNAEGLILPTYPELNQKAFKLAAFISNSVLIETGVDAIDPYNVFNRSPLIEPETPEEEKAFEHSVKEAYDSLRLCLSTRDYFRPTKCVSHFSHSAPLAHYADGIRTVSPLLKFEQFWKVVEHFFIEKGKRLDVVVSAHASKFDPQFTEDKIKELRVIRNRCIHPRAHRGHLSPEDLFSMEYVRLALEPVRVLAHLLLTHPPV